MPDRVCLVSRQPMSQMAFVLHIGAIVVAMSAELAAAAACRCRCTVAVAIVVVRAVHCRCHCCCSSSASPLPLLLSELCIAVAIVVRAVRLVMRGYQLFRDGSLTTGHSLRQQYRWLRDAKTLSSRFLVQSLLFSCRNMGLADESC